MHDTIQQSPFVSVVIPTYNRGWILREAVDSVLAQEYPAYEVIVVDDGSTDDTSSILRDYGNRIRVVRQENRGVSTARNRGVCEATGNLIAFLDSDDLWLPGKLETQVDFFRTHTEVLICQTEETWVRNGRRVNPKNRHKKPSGDIFEPSLELCLVSPSAVMLRRELFEEMGGFDETLPACEDYDLWLRIGYRYPVHLIDTPLIIKRGGHEDQLSRRHSLDKYRIVSLKKLIDEEDLSPTQRHAAIRMLINKCCIYVNGSLKRGRTREAVYYQALLKRFRTDLTEMK